MSVPVSRRKPSKNEVLHTAHEIESEIKAYIIQDFGIDPKAKLTEAEEFILRGVRKNFQHDTSKLIHSITVADSIEMTDKNDYELRRKAWVMAVGSAENIAQDCQTVIDQFYDRMNINKYYRLGLLILKEKDLIYEKKYKDRKKAKNTGCI